MAVAAGAATAASILVGVVGNLATNTIDDINAGWKVAIWVMLGVLASAMIFTAVRSALKSTPDPAVAEVTPSAPVVIPQPSPVKPRSEGGFAESWNGDEDLGKIGKYVWSLGGALMVGGGGLFFLIAAAYQFNTLPARFSIETNWPILMLAGLGFVFWWSLSFDEWSSLRSMQKLKPARARAIRIDDDGITSTDESGTQLIPWSAIDRAGVGYHTYRETYAGYLQLLTLQVRIHRSARPVLYRPVGWPENVKLPDVCRRPRRPEEDDWVPICVLGPLPEPRRLDFANAVNTYTKMPLFNSEARDW
ncbi:hypothetical protein ABT256_19090 [Amycolatopsis japonica]|uniref:hypothetical protein n=1 Tax=Amycolatopsis japonica TaxID=208439 RepID=UPI00332D3AD6